MKALVASTLPVALVLLHLSTPARAALVTLTFETVSSFESINTHYAGGTDSAGIAGPNLGVSFGGDVLGLKNDALGPYFSNAPSPLGVMTVVGSAAVMNVAPGFFDFSFFYSSSEPVADAVQIWSGLNGTGTLLRTVALQANAQVGCTSSPFCRFDPISTGSFSGQRAQSVSFANAAFVAAFDNISFNNVPEPGSAALAALGLAGLLLRRRWTN